MSPKSSFESLLKTALLGTGRDSNITPLEGELQPFSDSKRGAENALLSAAATLTLCERVGTLPRKSEAPTIEVCPPEARPYFSANAIALLTACIADQRELVPQALRWAGESGRIVPPSLLPPLLNLGRDSKELRRLIAPVLGERGRWLAQLNPDWRNVAAPIEDYETSWQEGETVARREALLVTRESDPAKARGWVEAAFKTDGAKERNQWLEILETRLSDEDEPFLENALDDKSKEVRATAVSLLEKLPDSRLVSRAKTELGTVLKWTDTSRKILGIIGEKTGELNIELPTEWHKEWARDGLEEKISPYSRVRNMGERAAWVHQWAGRVSPSQWTEAWGLTPQQLIDGVPKDWEVLLLTAWWEAAKRNDETQWLELIVAAHDFDTARQRLTFNALTTRSANRLALAAIERGSTSIDSNCLLTVILQAHPGPFDHELARVFLELARKTISKWREPAEPNRAGSYNWLHYYLPTFADKFPFELLDEARRNWPENESSWSHWEPTIKQFLARLQMRADVRAAFKQ